MTPSQPFRVTYTGKVQDFLRILLRESALAGVGSRVARALLEIEGRLELDARNWGDPTRHFRQAQLTRYRRVHDELAVEYAVHDSEPLVWVTDVAPVLSHPLRKRDNE
jgi:hypothetical protein